MLEIVTFAIAFVGYALLAWNAWLAASGQRQGWLLAVTTVVIVVHVYLVWGHRYEWSFAQATRNGYVGFVLFHTALLALVAANLATDIWSRRCVLFTWLVVTLGANGAVWRYEEVAVYRIPVILVALGGLVLVVRGYRGSR